MTRAGVLRLLVARSLRQHALASAVTMLSVALATGLFLAVHAIERQAREAFTSAPSRFDAVLGVRSSPLQLVLNGVFHLETSPGNLAWSEVEAVRADPRVALAVPFAVGDSYAGFRIVGTTAAAFAPEETEGGRFLRGAGRVFDETRREAVVGSFVAQRTGLRVGSHFHPSHDDRTVHEEDEYLVVGVRGATNTPADRAIWIPLEGMFRMEGHVLRGGGREFAADPTAPIPDAEKEVSGVLLTLRSPMDGLSLDRSINKDGRTATLAWPIGKIVADLFDDLGWAQRVLSLVAALVGVVAAASVLASVYNTIEGRRREFAILRALGARRGTVFATVVLESAAITAGGALLGFLVYAGVLAAAAAVIRAETGVVLDLVRFGWVHAAAPLAMTLLGALCGLVPAWRAYRTDVASNLAPST